MSFCLGKTYRQPYIFLEDNEFYNLVNNIMNAENKDITLNNYNNQVTISYLVYSFEGVTVLGDKIHNEAMKIANSSRPLDDFPDVLVGFTTRFWSGIEIAVDAAINGSKKLMEKAILAGGYIYNCNEE